MKNIKKVSIFFIGGKSRGYMWVQEMLKKKEELIGMLIMKEDDHEADVFSNDISLLLESHHIPYLITKTAKGKKYLNFIKKLHPALIIVMGWRTLIPEAIINIAPLGAIAVHESLLPKYRGFAPINWAIINGENKTGVTLFFLSEGIDNGEIIAQKTIRIPSEDSALSLYEKTSLASIVLLKKYLPLIKIGKAPRKKQIEKHASYTCARIPEDGLINWSDTTVNIHNLIRGLSYPYPGAFTYLNGEKLIISKAYMPPQRNFVGRIPGRIVSIQKNKGVEVLTGDGSIFIEEIIINEANRINPSSIINSIKTTLK